MVASAAADIALESLPPGLRNDRHSRLGQPCAALFAKNEQLRGETGRVRGQNQRLKARVCEPEGKVEELRRTAKRRAAPFSRWKR
jgi:hypothetical protein